MFGASEPFSESINGYRVMAQDFYDNQSVPKIQFKILSDKYETPFYMTISLADGFPETIRTAHNECLDMIIRPILTIPKQYLPSINPNQFQEPAQRRLMLWRLAAENIVATEEATAAYNASEQDNMTRDIHEPIAGQTEPPKDVKKDTVKLPIERYVLYSELTGGVLNPLELARAYPIKSFVPDKSCREFICVKCVTDGGKVILTDCRTDPIELYNGHHMFLRLNDRVHASLHHGQLAEQQAAGNVEISLADIVVRYPYGANK